MSTLQGSSFWKDAMKVVDRFVAKHHFSIHPNEYDDLINEIASELAMSAFAGALDSKVFQEANDVLGKESNAVG